VYFYSSHVTEFASTVHLFCTCARCGHYYVQGAGNTMCKVRALLFSYAIVSVKTTGVMMSEGLIVHSHNYEKTAETNFSVLHLFSYNSSCTVLC